MAIAELERQMPQLDGVEHSWHRVDGVRFHVAEAGKGDPVVLLHGWPQNWWMWRRLVPELARTRRVICVDFRGYGWSDSPARGYEKARWADDVLGVLDAMNIQRFSVVGHDWGGVVGFRLALDHADRVERLFALNTSHPWLRSAPAFLNAWRFWYGALIAAPVVGERLMHGVIIDRIASALHGAWTDEDRRIYQEQFHGDRARGAVLTYRTFLLRELPGLARGPHSGRLMVPTYFLHGDRDEVVRPSMLEGYEDRAPSMQLELVPGVGHFIVDLEPELVRDRVLGFLG